MKLTHQRMTNRYNNTPESILDWLEEQLENRGIDAVVYTRYILSLLQEDNNNELDDNGFSGISSVTDTSSGIGSGVGFKFCCEHQLIRKQTLNNSCVKENIKPVTTTKWKHKRYLKANTNNNNNCGNIVASGQLSRQQNLLSCHCCGNDYCSAFNTMNSDEERKLAVVECLKSASEQEFGIESFVDELCAKLKTIKLLPETDISLSETKELSIDCKSETSNNTIAVSPQEQAMKYYAAFPALEGGLNEEISNTKDNASVLAKKVAINKKSNGNKWNGRKIIQFMTNSISNNGLLHGLTNETSSQQTLTTAENCPNNSNPKLDALNSGNGLEEQKIGSKLDNNINEELVNEYNKKVSLSSLIQSFENKKFVYCGDIENNLLSSSDGMNSSLVVKKNLNNNNNNKPQTEECNTFQKLVDKFNSNIASIWSKTGDNYSNCSLLKNENIWSFDSSFSSNQSSVSSTTTSPKINTIDFWSKIAKTEATDELTVSTPTVDQMISSMTQMPEISWESSVLQSIGGISGTGFNGCRSDDDNETWVISDFGLIDSNKSSVDSTTITLQNHQENSPFIEFNSIISLTPKQSESVSDCLQLSALVPMASTLQNPNELNLPEENLLTSPKTHFQPIKQDSFDRDSSDEESVCDSTEVNKLVICSTKCPNNVDNKANDSSVALKRRPVSTSLDELASFMGPFNDIDATTNELSAPPINDEIDFNAIGKEISINNKMSDKSTSTEAEHEIELKPKLEPIMESSAENEPEYQDLCNMINEVLRNGLVEDESNTNSVLSLRNMVSMDDWYDDDIGEEGNEFISSRNREKRLSWNYYWDTYDTNSDTVLSHQNELFVNQNNCNKLLNDKAFNHDMRKRFSFDDGLREKTSNDCVINENYDEVFAEQLFTDNDCVDDCNELFDQTFDNYCFAEENGFDFDAVVDETHPKDIHVNDVDTFLDDYWRAVDDSNVISDDWMASDFEQPFRLQMKSRHNEAQKRKRKPCSFFIEGNCKRSDCKYSHDISNITCKYWEEGFCFKAHLCPFLHGYVTDPDLESDNTSALTSKTSYTIESESDFPSLAALPNNDDNNTTEQEIQTFDKTVDHHFFNFTTKSFDSKTNSATNGKLPIVVFMKKKVKKRKDRNLQ